VISAVDKYNYSSYKKSLSDLALSVGLEVHCYQPYPDFPDLQTVLVYNDALMKSEQAFIHISGTHGVEGAAGAEIQKHLLLNHGESFAGSPLGFLLIFALNPFGFHFIRRTSIANIDLNRNSGEELSAPTQDAKHQWLRPLWRSHSLWEQSRGLAQGLTLGAMMGFPWVVRAFAEGQTLEPQGLFFSGNQTAIEITSLMSHIKPLCGSKKSMRVIDVHSGLGRLYDEMLIHGAGDAKKLELIFDKEVEIPGEKPNSYRGHGLLSDRWALEFPDVDLQFVVQEFGVKSTAESLLALSLENQYHWKQFEKLTPALYLKHPVKDLLLKTFFCEDDKWIHWLTQVGSKRFMQWFSSTEEQAN
jgi:hypothetical protein